MQKITSRLDTVEFHFDCSSKKNEKVELPNQND